jgi:hypothetical protein
MSGPKNTVSRYILICFATFIACILVSFFIVYLIDPQNLINSVEGFFSKRPQVSSTNNDTNNKKEIETNKKIKTNIRATTNNETIGNEELKKIQNNITSLQKDIATQKNQIEKMQNQINQNVDLSASGKGKGNDLNKILTLINGLQSDINSIKAKIKKIQKIKSSSGNLDKKIEQVTRKVVFMSIGLFIIFLLMIAAIFYHFNSIISKFSRNCEKFDIQNVDDNVISVVSKNEFERFTKNYDRIINGIESKVDYIDRQLIAQKGTTPTSNLSFQQTKSGISNDGKTINNVTNPKDSFSNGEEYTKKLIQQYNNATQFEEQRRFEGAYKPIRLGLSPETVMALGRGELADVSLENRPDGDYWAIDISRYYSNVYLIIPRYTPFDDNIYKAGGMGKVFECPNFNPRFRYNSIIIIKPAMFTREGNAWKQKEMGKLKLEQGEQLMG